MGALASTLLATVGPQVSVTALAAVASSDINNKAGSSWVTRQSAGSSVALGSSHSLLWPWLSAATVRVSVGLLAAAWLASRQRRANATRKQHQTHSSGEGVTGMSTYLTVWGQFTVPLTVGALCARQLWRVPLLVPLGGSMVRWPSAWLASEAVLCGVGCVSNFAMSARLSSRGRDGPTWTVVGALSALSVATVCLMYFAGEHTAVLFRAAEFLWSSLLTLADGVARASGSSTRASPVLVAVASQLTLELPWLLLVLSGVFSGPQNDAARPRMTARELKQAQKLDHIRRFSLADDEDDAAAAAAAATAADEKRRTIENTYAAKMKSMKGSTASSVASGSVKSGSVATEDDDSTQSSSTPTQQQKEKEMPYRKSKPCILASEANVRFVEELYDLVEAGDVGSVTRILEEVAEGKRKRSDYTPCKCAECQEPSEVFEQARADRVAFLNIILENAGEADEEEEEEDEVEEDMVLVQAPSKKKTAGTSRFATRKTAYNGTITKDMVQRMTMQKAEAKATGGSHSGSGSGEQKDSAKEHKRKGSLWDVMCMLDDMIAHGTPAEAIQASADKRRLYLDREYEEPASESDMDSDDLN